MIILALDPGGTTGTCSIDWDGTPPTPDRHLGSEQVAFEDMPDWLAQELAYARPDLIVVERFFISPRTVKFTRQPEALYVIGGVMFMAQLEGVPIRMQAASDAKTAYPNERLKGWPVKGTHAKDALRHALLATHGHGVYDVRTQTQTKG
jgi:hypothetical protein